MDPSIDLISLNIRKRVVFCLACCERLFPSYARFCSEASFGNPQYMRTLLDDLWEAVEGGAPIATQFEAAINVMKDLAPDTDEYSTVSAAIALNFVAAVANTLEYVVHEDIDSLLSVPTQVTDAIDLWVMDRFGGGLTTELDELSVRDDPLYQTEQNQQVNDFHRLAMATTLTADVIREIRDGSSYDALVL